MLTRRIVIKRFIVFLLNIALLLTILSTPSIGAVFSLKDINGDDIKLLDTYGGYCYEFADSKKEAVFQIGKNVVTLGSDLWIDQKGNITEATLMRDTELIVGNKSVIASGGEHILFYDDGNIKSCVLSQDTELIVGDRRIVFKGGDYDYLKYLRGGIYFYRNGNVMGGVFAKETFFRVGKYQFSALQGDFLENGQIIRAGNLALSETEIGGNKYYFKSIYFSAYNVYDSDITKDEERLRKEGYQNEPFFIRSGCLDRETEYKIGSNTMTMSLYPCLHFYPNGVVERGSLSGNPTLKVGKRKITFAGKEIRFFADGTIQQGFLKNSTVVTIGDRNYEFSVGGNRYNIQFHKNGNVHRAVSNKVIVFDEGPSKGLFLYANTKLVFDENENLLLDLSRRSDWETDYEAEAEQDAVHEPKYYFCRSPREVLIFKDEDSIEWRIYDGRYNTNPRFGIDKFEPDGKIPFVHSLTILKREGTDFTVSTFGETISNAFVSNDLIEWDNKKYKRLSREGLKKAFMMYTDDPDRQLREAIRVRKDVEMARDALNRGANVNYRLINVYVPVRGLTERYPDMLVLNYSVYTHQYEIAKLLIEKGADVRTVLRLIFSQLSWVRIGWVTCTKEEINKLYGLVKMVLAAGASKDSIEESFFVVIYYGHTDLAKMLLKTGQIDDCRDEGLFRAVSKGYFEMVKMLIESGANPKALNSNKETPLSVAEKKGYREIVEYLKALK